MRLPAHPYLPALATSVNNLAIQLAEAGQHEEALALASEASTHYHDLARTDPRRIRDRRQTEPMVS